MNPVNKILDYDNPNWIDYDNPNWISKKHNKFDYAAKEMYDYEVSDVKTELAVLKKWKITPNEWLKWKQKNYK